MGKRDREEKSVGLCAEIADEEDEYKDNFSFLFNYEENEEEEEEKEDEEDHLNKEEEEEEEEEELGFAADFYRCGTDCSSLLSISNHNNNNNNNNNNDNNQPQKLKQANLFQVWGLSSNNKIKNNNVTTPSLKKQANLFQLWGSKNNNNNNKKPTKPAADVSKASSSSNPVVGTHPLRLCPFYKKIPGTPFTVDAFRYGTIKGCRGYILTHFHADHYGGLTKAWSHGPIYCTPLTARLLSICLYVNSQYIHLLELGTEYVIEGVKVTLLEANHCPGAALVHLRLPNGQCVLHTGDFRASKVMHQYPLLSNQRVNVVYLDTTYCNQKYRFPAKEDVLRYVVRVTQNCLSKQPKTLIVVGAYSIGKECVYIAISKALVVKIHADSRRKRILQSFGWPELSANLTSDGRETPLHVLPISSLKFEGLERYLKTFTNRYTAVLAFRPTGWTYSESIGSHLDLIKPTSKGRVTIYGVPYSEHSSFIELEEFIKFLRPDKVIPTVNVGNAAQRDKMQSYFREWLK